MRHSDKYKYLRQNPSREFAKVLTVVIVASIWAIFLLNIFAEALVSQIPMEVEMKIFKRNESKFWSSKNEHEIKELTSLMQKLVDVQDEQTYPF